MRTSQPSTAVNIAYSWIEQAILTGEFKPRQHLFERDLGRVLNLSRTPIREAIRRLEEAGLVRTEPNRGVVVKDFTAREVEDLYVVRLTLEKLAVDLLPRITPEELRELELVEAQMEDAFSARDFPRMRELNTTFHRGLTQATGNATLVAQLEELRKQSYLVRHSFWAEPDGPSASFRDHRMILEGIRNRDWTTVRRVVLEHVARPVRLYFKRLASTTQDNQEVGPTFERLLRRSLPRGNDLV